MTRAEHINGDADEVQHDRRHVEYVIGPVTPAREESVEVAEDLFGPEVDAAFAGITMCEFDNGDTLRKEEEDQRDDPEPDRDTAVRGDGRDNVQIEHSHDEEQDEIAAPEGADQVRLSVGLGGGGQFSCLVA